MEKAYAKLHKSYEILNGGSATEALVDLTGMVVEKYDLNSSEIIIGVWPILERSQEVYEHGLPRQLC